ncbi:hypothetical protein [Paenibacillus sp. GYB003]|uniref:hypothetical protein n=1 Tax=Paenibacillus sp. GYB003 TaxID=2994392 RepID=UPI002F9687D6
MIPNYAKTPMWVVSYKGKVYSKPMGRKQAERLILQLQHVLVGLELVEVPK